MKHLRKRLCSLLLCAVLVAGLLPMGNYAHAATEASTAFLSSYPVYETPEARAEAVNKLRYKFLGEMLSHIGCAYVKGKGHFLKAQSFDCSGLVAHAFISIGYSRYFSVSDKKWDPGKYQAYDCNGLPSSDWKDFSWRGSRGFLENVKDGQKVYLIPDSSKNPVLVFTVRKSDKKKDFQADISNPAKWSDDFRDAVSQRGTILVKNHVDQTKWHVTTVVGYYDEEWFRENGHDINPAKASISSVKSIIRKDLMEEFSSYGLRSVLTKVHTGLANGRLPGDKAHGKSTNSSFNDLDREDDVYPAMWDLRQRKITSEWKYSPLWQIDALNPRMGVSVNNNTLAANQDSSVAMLLEWEQFGSCHLTDYDNASQFGGEDRPIAGAVYGIYDKSGTYEQLIERKPLETVVADENGLATFNGLLVDGVSHEAVYHVIELSPPPGCGSNRSVYTVTVRGDKDVEIVEGGAVTNNYLTGSVSIQLDKLGCLWDADAGTWDQTSEGAYQLTGITVKTAGISNPASTLSNATVAYRILAAGDITLNGQVLYPSGTVVCIASGSANGTVTATELPLGSYTIVLHTPPEGWSDTSPAGATRVYVVLSEDEPFAMRTLASSKLSLNLEVSVTDRLNRPVSGGRFALCCEQDIYDYSGKTLLIAKDTPIAIGSADGSGSVRFGAVDTETYDADGYFASTGSNASTATADDLISLLPTGYVYYITELDAPEGFVSKEGRVAEFTYTSLEWISRDTGNREISIPYSYAQPVADTELLARATEAANVIEEPAAAGTGAALPLLLLLVALGIATTALLLIQRRQDRCLTT
ncbi:MAG: hypothetical protein J5649_01270 [Lachnospiraceae bacterium]|nr:hypothetical protein [Lachnospiraceae bacterium]